MANNPKDILYDDFYKKVGIAALWTQPAKIRVYRGSLVSGLKPGPRNSAADKAKLARIVSKVPEVMVKVSGRTKDGGHLQAHLDYITRNGQLPAETDYGLLKGKEEIADLHADWSDDEVIYKGQHQVRKTAMSVNMVLSMPAETDRSAFRDAVRDFVNAELRPRVDVVIAFHDDTDHPHAHVTVRGRQHNGKAFNPGKLVLERYREQFASALRDRGVEAEATRRYVRGHTLRSERSAAKRIRMRGEMPRMERVAIAEAHAELKSKTQTRDWRPWEQASRTRHEGTRAQYEAAARELAGSADPEDRQLAQRVEEFAKSLPQPMFVRDIYQEALERQLTARVGRDQVESEQSRGGSER